MSTDFKKFRKQMLIRFLLLTAFCLLIILISLMTGRGTLTVSLSPYESDYDNFDAGGNLVEWENGELPMKMIRKNGRTDLVFSTERAGEYELSILTKDRERYLFYDRIHVTDAGLAWSRTTCNFSGCNGAMLAILLFFAGMGVNALVGFFRLKGPAQYSYDAMFCAGGGFFCAAASIELVIIYISRLVKPELYHMNRVLISAANAPESFVFITMLPVLVFSVLMIVSNIELLRHEQFRVNNILGLGVGILLIGCNVFLLFFLSRNFMGSRQELRIYTTLNCVLSAVYSYFECVLAGAVVCGFRAAGHVPAADQDYILILGCRFRPDGTLTPLLRGRADKAVEFWRNQKEQTGREAVLVPSGGQGTGESMPEAEAISRYLISCGVPESAILKEDRSVNTYQNMEFSREKIREREAEKEDGREKVNTMFVTTNYHVFRSGVWANNAGFPSEGLGSRTKWWFWPNAFMRECVGLLVNKLVPEIIGLIVIVAAYSGIVYLTSAVY